jgi:hypothetical protein
MKNEQEMLTPTPTISLAAKYVTTRAKEVILDRRLIITISQNWH